MATRYILKSRKERNCSSEKEIVGICGVEVDGTDFPFYTKETIHDHIKSGLHVYWSRAAGVPDAKVFQAGAGADRYIQTDADLTRKNNLINLPDC